MGPSKSQKKRDKRAKRKLEATIIAEKMNEQIKIESTPIKGSASKRPKFLISDILGMGEEIKEPSVEKEIEINKASEDEDEGGESDSDSDISFVSFKPEPESGDALGDAQINMIGEIKHLMHKMEFNISKKMANLKIDIKSSIRKEIEGQLKVVESNLKATVSSIEKKLESSLETKFKGYAKEQKWELNRLDQYGRKWNFRIYGIEESEKEDCKEKVVEFGRDKLNIEVNKADIDIAHRTLKRVQGKPRAIIVRCHKHDTKVAFMKGKKMLREKNISNYGIVEDLTVMTKGIRDELREKKTQLGLEYVWTIDGKIKVKKVGKPYVMEINTPEKLAEIVKGESD